MSDDPAEPQRRFSVDYSGATAEAFIDDVLDLLMRKHGLDVHGADDVPWEPSHPLRRVE